MLFTTSRLILAITTSLLLPTTVVATGTEQERVLVYIANENAPEGAEQENYEEVLNWLRSDGREKAARTVTSLDSDRHLFPQVVDLEVSLLTDRPDRRSALSGLVIATNRLLRSGHCLVYQKGGKKTQEMEIPFSTDHKNLVLNANPVSRPEILSQLLTLIADQFDPATHRFVVVFKSHGSAAKVLTPRLTVQSHETSEEEILKLLNEEVAEEQLPVWIDQLGVSKSEFLDLLATAGNVDQMQFELVFLEACNATAHDFSLEELPENVEQFLFIHGSANYQNLLYEDVLCDGSEDLAQAMLDAASAKFVLIDRNASPHWMDERVLYLLPLVLWIAWLIACRQQSLQGGPVEAGNISPEPVLER